MVQAFSKGQIVAADVIKYLLAEVHQVHLVDRHNHMAHAQQRHNKAVAAGLRLHATAGVDQNHRQVAGGGTGGHIAGVLLVPWAVGNDELALLGAEIAVSHVDGDALFALSLQAIHQQGQVDVLVGGVVLLRVFGNRGQVVFKNQLGIMQQAANQGGFAVIDVAAGDKAQQVFVFVLFQIAKNVAGNQFGLV